MPKLFISYRREDSDFPAHQIYKALSRRFGQTSVFFDVDTIPPGVDFRKHLSDSVSRCDILLAVIGSRWLEAEHPSGQRRLEDARDFVRIEIEAALKRDIPVVPVLVGRVLMPGEEDLPTGLKDLSYRNAVEVRSGRDFDHDLGRLIEGLEKLFRADSDTKPPLPTQTVLEPPTSEQDPTDGVPYSPLEPAPQETTPVAVPESESAQPAVASQPTVVSQPIEIVTNSLGMKLALIPSGAFLMGSQASDTMGESSEKPQHQVEITKPFYLGITPVTRAENEKVVGRTSSRTTDQLRRPVERVSWLDAVGFCNALSERESLPPYYKIDGKTVSILSGSGYRLPTEAEWEYACRADTATNWSFGDDESQLGQYAWFALNSETKTHTVGEKKSNAWGLHDMHGNVYEWCWDWFESYRPGPVTDPRGPKSGSRRVLRGGSFGIRSAFVRSAFRVDDRPDNRGKDIGFRVARTCD